MNRLLVMVVVVLTACAGEPTTADGVPYLLTEQTISRSFASGHLADNVMVLADTSSAMATRLTQMQTAMNTVLTSSDAIHQRWGLTTFPSLTTTVALPSDTGPDQDSVLAANANAVNSALQTLMPNGATDTKAALQFTGGLAALNANDNRGDVIVLLTGGVPDGDPQDTIDLLTTLREQHQITTIVVAFSPEAGSEAVFDAMARAGGGAHYCVPDANACGANQTCSADGICSRAFFDETNATSLLDPLKPIINELWTTDPCLFQLSVPPEYVSVTLDGVALFTSYDTWHVEGSQLILTGKTCDRVHNATMLNPATVDIRVVEKQ